MGCASFTILWMKIQLEWHAIIFCSVGAFFGMVFGKYEKYPLSVFGQTSTKLFILGLEVIDDILSAPIKKLTFVCVWFSFAFALFLLNRYNC